MALSSPAAAPKPRISVNDLALFMVSSDTGRLGIIKRAKYPKAPPIIRYRDVRTALVGFLADPGRNLQHLTSAESMFEQRAADTSESSLRQDDARQSIEVLHALQQMQNQIAAFNFQKAPATQAKLILSGVEVSVRADLLVNATQRGVEQIGAAILRMTQDATETEAAKDKRKDMGTYVATLARMHLEKNLLFTGTPANRLCMSIDVQHGEVFPAPTSSTRRALDIENACRFITAAWPGI